MMLSGEDGDFSISSMSQESASVKNNKSSLHKNSSGAAKHTLGKALGKSYFIDGEQLLRHFSPSQPRHSPRELANETGMLLNAADLHSANDPQNQLRLGKQHSGKRSSTSKRQRPQTSKQFGSGYVRALEEGNKTTLDSENITAVNLLVGKTVRSPHDGLIQHNFASGTAYERADRSQERERSKSKGKL